MIMKEDYISNIGDLYGDVKNVTIKGKLIGIKIFEFNDTIMCLLNVGDNTGEISAFLISDKDASFKDLVKSLTIDDTYVIRGNITRIDEDYIDDFYKETNTNLEEYLKGKRIILIKAINKQNWHVQFWLFIA